MFDEFIIKDRIKNVIIENDLLILAIKDTFYMFKNVKINNSDSQDYVLIN